MKTISSPLKIALSIAIVLHFLVLNHKANAQCDGVATFTDARDGQTYSMIQFDGNTAPYCLGNSQCWMGQNLNVGQQTGPANDMNDAGSLAANQDANNIEKYCDGGISASQTEGDCSTRGGLYQWDEAMAYTTGIGGNGPGPQGICPTGWHIPTDNEWKCLEMNIGMTQAQTDGTLWRGTTEGDQLKNVDDCFGGTNCGTSGFEAAELGGPRSHACKCFSGGVSSMTYWTSSVSGANSWRRHLEVGRATIARNASNRADGYWLRCVRDNAPIPLPVELLYFKANWTDSNYETATLSWETITETNNSHFEIERSTDAVNFEYLKTIDGNGTSNQNVQYSTLDEKPYTNGTSYYRLKQVDKDGSSQYSNIEVLNVPEGLSLINLYPNPTTDRFNLLITSSENTDVIISVKNTLGQEVRKWDRTINQGFTSLDFDVSTLRSGNYFIEINTTSGVYHIERKFVKANQ